MSRKTPAGPGNGLNDIIGVALLAAALLLLVAQVSFDRNDLAFIPHQWAALQDAVGWIRASGGVAVVAHPGRYKYAKSEMREFFGEFRDCGGAGIEVVTGSHAPEQYFEFARCAREFGLLASRGSDYHGKGESRADLGALPPLPDDLKPVWHDW